MHAVEIDVPITIAMDGSYWYLSVNSAGAAELTIPDGSGLKHRSFVVARQKLAELAEALDRERFFDLDRDYGQFVPEGTTNSITVVKGNQANTVRLHFLGNWALSDQSKLVEPGRAIRIRMIVSSWFDDAETLHNREYYQKILDKIPK